MKNRIHSENRKWGSGMFRDIAKIRRGVYTEYYVMVEHADTLKEILGRAPEAHCQRLLKKIESPEFNIDAFNYEEIKAYLWHEALFEFGSEIETWLGAKAQAFQAGGQRQLQSFLTHFADPSMNWRRAVLLSAAMIFFDLLSEPSYDELMPQMLAAIEREGQPDSLIVEIDFFDRFYQNIILQPQRIVLLAGDLSTLALDLKIYGECLLDYWSTVENDVGAVCSVTLLVNENYCPRNNNKTIQRNATLADVEAALLFEGLEKLREYREAGLFQIHSFAGEFAGVVEADLKEDEAALLHDADYIVALGEQNNITLIDLPVNSFRIFAIRDFSSIFFTGIKNNVDDHRYPKLALLDVPAHIRPAIDYMPDLKTVTDAGQYHRLYRSVSAETWDMLIETARSMYDGNVLEAALHTVAATADQQPDPFHWLVANNSAEMIARHRLDEFHGAYRRLIAPTSPQVERAMHVIHYEQGAISKNGERLALGVTFANQINKYNGKPKSLLTYDDVARQTPVALFGFNMLYFITRNLILKFNQVNPHFNLHESFFGEYIDFLKLPGRNGGLFYPSLYNKGAIGVRQDGAFEFGRIRMPGAGTVAIPIDGEVVSFSWTALNPLTDFSDHISMFTPMEPRFANPNLRAPHFVGNTCALYMLPANDNYNFVFINNILLGVVRGSTEIPPFGTALSVSPQVLPSKIKHALDRRLAAPGRKQTVTKDHHVRFIFALDDKWSDCEWIMGGALLMVDDGKIGSLDLTKDDSPNSTYHIEGWNLDSSQRTQETPVETNLREARMTIGLTDDNQFFISVIDGRANNRTGATHVETVAWLTEYFERQSTSIRYALDLDSASSVSLGVFHNSEFLLLNQTARGSDSKLYDTRYYNHLGYLYKKPAYD